jgi:hypothetical protein
LFQMASWASVDGLHTSHCEITAGQRYYTA